MEVNQQKHTCFSVLSHLFLMMFMVVFALSANAQQTATTVTLKTGMVIRGEVVTFKQNEYLEIKTPVNSNMRILWSDIQSIEFVDVNNSPAPTAPVKSAKMEYARNDSGYYFSMSGGFPFGLDGYDYPSLGLSVSGVIGKSFNQHASLGVLVGYDFYWNPNTGIIPLGLEFKGRMRNKGLSPYYYVQTGYGIKGYSDYESSWNMGEAKGGMFFAPGIGLTNKRQSHSAWFLQLGFKTQQAEASYFERIWDNVGRVNRTVYVTDKLRFNRFDLKFGFTFD